MRFVGSIRKDVTDYTPEAGRSNLEGLVLMNAEQEGRTAGLFRDKWLSKMWRK